MNLIHGGIKVSREGVTDSYKSRGIDGSIDTKCQQAFGKTWHIKFKNRIHTQI